MRAVCFVCKVERSCLPAGPFDEPMCEDCMTETRQGMRKLSEQLVGRPSPTPFWPFNDDEGRYEAP